MARSRRCLLSSLPEPFDGRSVLAKRSFIRTRTVQFLVAIKRLASVWIACRFSLCT
uniref:hypothetical protein n=1 Tax=uncultured Megasphaera sp. TaxID=165188 RepID=UPI00259106E8|nr:hypothetical protein [uncultured Megasphaera sp.]